MFAHLVLFEIEPKQVRAYRKDCKMWASYARKHKGFLEYSTVRRLEYKNQFASVYAWKSKKNHDAFMNKLHDWLVSKSKAKVKVLAYYNFNAIDKISAAK
ncbi:MAG: antibiotic biosynthesis monooxygenase [Candidatus Omnitrophota bacterium]|nr:antibiotic biosynthesis monooxygenase [Candidatus Omnitrophota bacterium]